MSTSFQMKIRWWLLALVLLAVLPFFGFSAFTVYELGRSGRDAIRSELLQRTQAAANVVKQRLDTTVGYLNSIATSEAAVHDDLPALYEHARRVVGLNRDAAAITLVAPDGRMVFHTMMPYGTPAPSVSRPDAVRRVFETGLPVASGPFIGPISGKWVASVGVPVLRQGKTAYCLRMVLWADSLNTVLAEERLPADWTAALVDREGVLVARTRSPELYVGQPAVPAVAEAARNATQGILDSALKEGTPAKLSVVRVPGWDWSVAVAVPSAALNAPLYRSLLQLLVSGAVFALVGIVAARWLSRVIEQQVGEVASASRALQRGERLRRPRARILELDQMAQALTDVDARERRTNVALASMISEHREISNELMLARRDALTGLPGRALFEDSVQELHEALVERDGHCLAVLFIDLDGFKQLNDNQGHEQGDRVLLQVAQILKEVTREVDIAGRIGGDEFAVCVAARPDSIEPTAGRIAARAVERVAAIGQGISCSIGIAICSDSCAELACLMQQADAAMYEAKRRGKNRYVFFGGWPQAA